MIYSLFITGPAQVAAFVNAVPRLQRPRPALTQALLPPFGGNRAQGWPALPGHSFGVDSGLGQAAGQGNYKRLPWCHSG